MVSQRHAFSQNKSFNFSKSRYNLARILLKIDVGFSYEQKEKAQFLSKVIKKTE